MTSPSEWSPEFLEFGHWMELDEVSVWIPHCVQHPGFPKPCYVCEAASLGLDEGPE